jgi:hypothetical protein
MAHLQKRIQRNKIKLEIIKEIKEHLINSLDDEAAGIIHTLNELERSTKKYSTKKFKVSNVWYLLHVYVICYIIRLLI